MEWDTIGLEIGNGSGWYSKPVQLGMDLMDSRRNDWQVIGRIPFGNWKKQSCMGCDATGI